MLTQNQNSSILLGIEATASISISLLKLLPSAQALTRRAFFVPDISCHKLWWVVWEHLTVRRYSVSGKANPVRPATLLISLNGCSSQTFTEDLTVPNTISTRKTLSDIEALARIGETATNHPEIDASDIDVLFTCIKDKTAALQQRLDCSRLNILNKTAKDS